MRKLFFFLPIALFLGNLSPIFAQNYLAFNSENIRTSVDGAANDYFGLNVKTPTNLAIQHAVGAVFCSAQNGLNTPYYGLTYNFAYPISVNGSSRFYLAANPAFVANSSKIIETVTNQMSYGVNIPVVAEWHFGASESFGTLFGLGVAYSYIENKSTGFLLKNKAFGPLAEVGIRVPIAGKSYLLKSSYQLNFANETIANYATGNVFNLSLTMAF
jgi:hypothetical protein